MIFYRELSLQSLKNKLFFLAIILSFIVTSNKAAYAFTNNDLVVAYSHLTNGYWQIWLTDAEGKNQKQLTFTPSDKRNPAWLDEGKKIAYRNNSGQLYTTEVETGVDSLLLQNYNGVSESHFCDKTKEITFIRYDPISIDKNQVWVSNISGQNLRVLTKDPLIKFTPRFSSNGDRIVYARKNTNHEGTALWSIHRDGQGLTQLTPESIYRDSMPDFSLNSKMIAFTSNREGNYEIFILNISSKRFENISHNDAFDIYPTYSADGKQIAFVSNRSGNRQVWVMRSDGNNARMLTSGDESIEPSWRK